MHFQRHSLINKISPLQETDGNCMLGVCCFIAPQINIRAIWQEEKKKSWLVSGEPHYFSMPVKEPTGCAMKTCHSSTRCVCARLFSVPLRVEMLSSKVKYAFAPLPNKLCENTCVFMWGFNQALCRTCHPVCLLIWGVIGTEVWGL